MHFRWQDRVGSYTDFDGQVNDYAPYALLDARLTYQQPKWKIYAEANNRPTTSSTPDTTTTAS